MRHACPVEWAVGRTRPHSRPDAAPVLDGISVVIADLGGHNSVAVGAALQHAGASVRVVSNLPDAWRSTVPFVATVVVDPPATTGSIRAGLRVLSRHGAVLALSVNATTRERIALLNSGADNVLPTVDPDEVVAALAALVRRARMPTTRQMSQIVLAGEIRLHLQHRTATTAQRTLALTRLEFDLLAYFVAHAGEALSRERLLENVWGYDIGGRETVTVHIRRLRQKIEINPSRPTLLLTVWGIGYRLNPSPMTGPVPCQTFGDDPETFVQQRAAGSDA